MKYQAKSGGAGQQRIVTVVALLCLCTEGSWAQGFRTPSVQANRPAFNPVPRQPQGSYQGAQRQGAPVQRFWQQRQPSSGAPDTTRGEHLQQWMDHHNQLSSQQQHAALQNEPGFRNLPQPTQQRMLDRLDRLNSLPPQQRARVLQRSEAIEKLSPEQRGQVRNAMGQLGALPLDRRRAVGKTFRDLRNLPSAQQSQILSSPEYRQQFSDQERSTLNNLLRVSPILPPQ